MPVAIEQLNLEVTDIIKQVNGILTTEAEPSAVRAQIAAVLTASFAKHENFADKKALYKRTALRLHPDKLDVKLKESLRAKNPELIGAAFQVLDGLNPSKIPDVILDFVPVPVKEGVEEFLSKDDIYKFIFLYEGYPQPLKAALYAIAGLLWIAAIVAAFASIVAMFAIRFCINKPISALEFMMFELISSGQYSKILKSEFLSSKQKEERFAGKNLDEIYAELATESVRLDEEIYDKMSTPWFVIGFMMQALYQDLTNTLPSGIGWQMLAVSFRAFKSLLVATIILPLALISSAIREGAGIAMLVLIIPFLAACAIALIPHALKYATSFFEAPATGEAASGVNDDSVRPDMSFGIRNNASFFSNVAEGTAANDDNSAGNARYSMGANEVD